MAKLSARHSFPVQEFFVLFPEGYEMGPGYVLDHALKVFFVLRSDGAVLTAHSNPDAPTAYDRKRSGYTLKGKLRGTTTLAEHKAGFDTYRNTFVRRHDGTDVVVSDIKAK